MKFSLLTAFAAGAALTQVSASPIRVMVVSSEVHSTNVRFGHALAPNNIPKISMVVPSPPEHNVKMKGGCRGSRFRQKAIDFSNAIRKSFGLSVIENNPVPAVEEDRVRILPFIGTPNSFVEMKKDKDGDLYIAQSHHGHHVGFRQRLAHTSFIHRLHIALMALGPWEGRAVAFVLGCGIGVLLRMIWVLAIVTYRLLRGPRLEENEYTEILFVEEIAEPVHVDAPPTYSYPDEYSTPD
ncbi:hypothetical protein J132_08405 [Termitomyces sp. J132]|nr:hypothetical protein J132_08405 [Termitomyces sp. J132]